MHISDITIANIPPFTAEVKFVFDERVNVFIGPNASGKSTVLKALSPDTAQGVLLKSEDGTINRRVGGGWPVNPDRTIDAYAVPRIYLPSVRTSWPAEHDRQQLLSRPYGWRNLEAVLTDNPEVFDTKAVFHAISMLHESGQRYPHSNAKLAQIAMSAHSCSKMICHEIMTGGLPQHYMDVTASSERRTSDGLPEELISTPVVRYANAVNIVDSHAAPVFIGELSSGTQGVYLWLWYLAFRIAEHYNHDWQTKPAVLLIDEIENHLHPTWQRRVIPALLDTFKGLQIFATTHSPFVVAGLKAGQVHLLNRDADGVVTASTNTEDIVGWTADEILRTMMGVDDPTDDATATAARELRELRSEGPRADEREEEARQERIRELRRLVDRDLLAGGPAAAQRELFEQQFAEALEKYRQSRDLGQENG